jgi:LPXTG-site transpeptidase (sortase) family protein
MSWPSNPILRKINRLLIVFIVVCNSYVIIAPLLPRLVFSLEHLHSRPAVLDPNQPSTFRHIDRNINQLIIPGIYLKQPVLDGTDPTTVNRGIWRRPKTSTPDQPGNTVLVGHRYSYRSPSVFYFLDKVKVGDRIAVVWHKQLYFYSVSEINTVLPTKLSVEAQTQQSQLTIYTCTPLWSTSHRLVIIAKPEGIHKL